MAIILEGSGTVTGITTFTTPLDDIKFDSIEVTGIATASTFQVGTGVSIGNPRLQNIALYTNDTEFVTVDNAGNVGFGTTNAQIAAQASNAKVINAGIVTANQYYGNQLTAVGSRVTGVGTFENGLDITGNIVNGLNVSAGIATLAADVSIADKIIHTGDTNTTIRFPSADTVTVETNGTEAIRIDSSARFLLGTTSARTSVGAVGDPFFQQEGLGSDTGAMSIIRNTNSAAGSYLVLGKTRGTSDGSNTIVQDDDTIGSILFAPADGNDVNQVCASLTAIMDGTPGSNDVPGALTFQTTADSGSQPSERMRITSTGDVSIGNPTVAFPSGTGLQVYNASVPRIKLTNSTTGVASGDGFQIYVTGSSVILDQKENAEMRFYTNGTEALRIDSSGRLLAGSTTNHASFGTLLQASSASSTGSLSLNRYSANAYSSYVYFFKSRNASVDGQTVVQDGDNLGGVLFYGSDGTNAASAAGIYGEVDGTPGDGDMPGRLVFKTTPDGTEAGVERMRIHSNGNVSIGNDPTVASDTLLHVEKAAEVNVILDGSTSTLGARITLKNSNTTANSYNQIDFADAGGQSTSTIKAINTDQTNNYGELVFLTRSAQGSPPAERMRIDSDGNVDIEDGNLVIKTSGHGIDFSATGNSGHITDAELLTDYERGQWNPGFTFGGGNSGWGWSSEGHYEKIGNVVTCIGYLDFNAKGSSTGVAKIIGLPYTVADIMEQTSQEGSGNFSYFANMNTNGYSFYSMWLNGGSTNMTVQRHNNSTAVSQANDGDFASNTQIRIWCSYFTG